MSVKEQIKLELDNLPETELVEIYDFVRFLKIKKEREKLSQMAQTLSEKSFDNIWNNEEDSIYDNL